MKSRVLALVGLWLFPYWVPAMEILSEQWFPIVEPGPCQSLLAAPWKMPLTTLPGLSVQYTESHSTIYQLPGLDKLRRGLKRLLTCLNPSVEEAAPLLSGSLREGPSHRINPGADQRLGAILLQIEEILKQKNVKLILSLDIDKTISYGTREDVFHRPYFQFLRTYMNATCWSLALDIQH